MLRQIHPTINRPSAIVEKTDLVSMIDPNAHFDGKVTRIANRMKSFVESLRYRSEGRTPDVTLPAATSPRAPICNPRNHTPSCFLWPYAEPKHPKALR